MELRRIINQKLKQVIVKREYGKAVVVNDAGIVTRYKMPKELKYSVASSVSEYF
jgi:hypothetical protein